MKKFWFVLFVFCLGLLLRPSVPVLSKNQVQIGPQIETQFDSQKPLAREIKRAKDEGKSFPTVELFQSRAERLTSMGTSREVEIAEATVTLQEGSILSLNNRQMTDILRRRPDTLTLRLPRADATPVELELIKADIFDPDFRVVTSESGETAVPYVRGLHYRGIVKDELSNSIAAISIFPGEIGGFFSTKEDGNIVLGKLGGSNKKGKHVLYADKDVKNGPSIFCGTKDDGVIAPQAEISGFTPQSGNKVVRVYVEVDNDIWGQKGGYVGAANYVEMVFNQSATLYANDGIPIVLSEMFVWIGPSPYAGSTIDQVLAKFQARLDCFNGDIAHLVAFHPTGNNKAGIAAGFNAFCNPNPDARMCASSIDPMFNKVPMYSWTIQVFTHEMGHLMGSRHTHACVWNGNGTAIDGCAAPEGSCPLAPLPPPGGGTIMSYCNLQPNVTINFLNGFGPQPANLIRNNVNNASCLPFSADAANLVANVQSGTQVFFDWNDVPGADRYWVDISQDPAFGSFERRGPLVVSNYTWSGTPLTPGSTWYWRVLTVACFGPAYSIPSPPSFNTGGNNPPSPPTNLVAVVQGPSQVILDWSDAAGADGYFVDISQDPNFSTFQNRGPLTSSEYTWNGPPLFQDSTWYWRVYTFNSFGSVYGIPSGPFTMGPPPFPPASGDTMYGNQALYPDHGLTSSDGRFTLYMQADGNLVLYRNPGQVLWSSDTFEPGSFCIMQLDGNFVIYTAGNQPIWATNIFYQGSQLSVQSDGNVVIYAPGGVPVWATDTAE